MSVPAAAAVAMVAVLTWPAASVTTPAPAAIAPEASSSWTGRRAARPRRVAREGVVGGDADRDGGVGPGVGDRAGGGLGHDTAAGDVGRVIRVRGLAPPVKMGW
jgi:hypothetical protein